MVQTMKVENAMLLNFFFLEHAGELRIIVLIEEESHT